MPTCCPAHHGPQWTLPCTQWLRGFPTAWVNANGELKIAVFNGDWRHWRILTKALKGKSAEPLKMAPIKSIKIPLEAIRLSLWANQAEPSGSISLQIRKISLSTSLSCPGSKNLYVIQSPPHLPHDRVEAPPAQKSGSFARGFKS